MIPGVGVGTGVRDATAAAISPAVPPPLSSAGALVVSGAGGALVELGSTVATATAVTVVVAAGVSVPQADTSMANNIHASRITLTTLLLILFVSELFIVTSSGLLVLCQELLLICHCEGKHPVFGCRPWQSQFLSICFKHLFFRCSIRS
jgi:hypothetical protein